MKVAVLFTYDYSLETWDKSGTLDRELKIYQKLYEKFNIKFIFVTYGNRNEYNYLKNYPYFEIIPIYEIVKIQNNRLLKFLKSFLVPFKLKSKLKDVDILHQHQLLGSWVSIILKSLIKKPLLLRTGYDMTKFSELEKKSMHIIFFYKLLNLISFYASDLVTVTSKSDFEILKNKFNSNKIKIRKNWVENNNQYVDINDRFLYKVLCVGRLENQKNFNFVINEISKLPHISIDLYGIGSLEQELKLNSINKNINLNLKGSIPHEKLLSIYPNYTFFITSSSFEGNPKTLLEAMASGCIVFASDIPNHKELIQNLDTGFVFKLEDGSLKNKFNLALKNKSLLKKISLNAKKFVEKNNNIENLCEAMYKDYINLIY